MGIGYNQELLRKIVLTQDFGYRLCTIKSVDETELTCTVQLLDNQEIEIEDVRLYVTSQSLNISIPETGATGICYKVNGKYFVKDWDKVKKYYQATEDESILEIMLDFIAAIKKIQLTHPQGPTNPNGVINVADFLALEERLKIFYLK